MPLSSCSSEVFSGMELARFDPITMSNYGWPFSEVEHTTSGEERQNEWAGLSACISYSTL